MLNLVVPVGSELNEGLGHDEKRLSLRARMKVGFRKKWLCLKAEPLEHQCERRNKNQRTTDGTIEMTLPFPKEAFDSMPHGRSKNGG